MPHTAYLPIIVDRYAAVVRHIFLFGLDLTGRDMRAQVRLYGDVPGPPLIDLLPVSNGNAQGLRLVEVSIDDAGVPTSHVEMVINETTMEGLPYAGEIGDVTTLAWDWQVTIAGRKRRLAKGEFQITGDGVTGAEVAPANRIQPYGIPQRPVADVWSSARMTFGEEQVTVEIDGVDLIAPFAKKADDAAARAELAETQAGLAAGAAQAVSRYFTTRAAGEAASAVDQAFATDDGAGNVIYYKRTSGGSTEIGRAVTPARLRSAGGADDVGYRASAAAIARVLAARLRDDAIYVTDFMTAEQVADTRTGNPTLDVGPAFNSAFAVGQATGRTVFVPDGVYGIGTNLLFGSSRTDGQSDAPLGLIGQSKTGTIIKALPGLAGTLLRSWSLAGVVFAYFHLDTTASTAQAWDCRWRPNDPNRAGPSTQCSFHDILVSGTSNLAQLSGQSPVTAHVTMDDMNDSYPTNMTVRVSDPMQKGCAWSFVGGGGLMSMAGCIWAGGYLRWGCQNGEMLHSWGQGIEFASHCLNTTVIMAGYPYPNATRKAVYWSEKFDAFQSVKSLTIIASQIGTLSEGESYFDLNIYSKIKVIGSEFIGPAAALLGPNARSDSFATALVELDGGKHTGNLVLTDKPGVVVVASGFINDATGRAEIKDWRGSFAPMIYGGTQAGGTADGTYGRYTRDGNRVHFEARLYWSTHPGAGGPARVVLALPFDVEPQSIGNVSLEYRGSTFPAGVTASLGGFDVSFYDPGQFALPASGDIKVSGSLTVR